MVLLSSFVLNQRCLPYVGTARTMIRNNVLCRWIKWGRESAAWPGGGGEKEGMRSSRLGKCALSRVNSRADCSIYEDARPPSFVSEDIPPQAFGRELKESLVHRCTCSMHCPWRGVGRQNQGKYVEEIFYYCLSSFVHCIFSSILLLMQQLRLFMQHSYRCICFFFILFFSR